MNPSRIIDITISSISKELFNDILTDIITAIVNLHFNTGDLPEEIYNYIYFKDGSEINYDVNNLMLIA